MWFFKMADNFQVKNLLFNFQGVMKNLKRENFKWFKINIHIHEFFKMADKMTDNFQ